MRNFGGIDGWIDACDLFWQLLAKFSASHNLFYTLHYNQDFTFSYLSRSFIRLSILIYNTTL